MFKFFTRYFWLKTALLLVGAAGVFAVCRLHCRTREFVNPVAYTVMDGSLFVMERAGNRLLELVVGAGGQSLHLRAEHRIEPDDADYFYMVRKLYPGPAGRLVVHSYVYEQASRKFLGYRFRLYDPARPGMPEKLLKVLFAEPTLYPEMRYACDRDGNHFFVTTSAGGDNIWSIAAGQSAHVVDHPAAPVRTLGERNDAWAAWNSIQVGPDGNIFLACGASGKVVMYDSAGGRLREFGRVGTGPGDLLAPDDLTFVSLAPDQPARLTVASSGNRTWLQYDDRGRVAQLIDPREQGYPHEDIMVGSLLPHPELGVCAFDLVNRCLVVPGERFAAVGEYVPGVGRLIPRYAAAALCLLLLLFVLPPLCRRLRRMRYPLFAKLLILFLPAVLAASVAAGLMVGVTMSRGVHTEAERRMANLSRAIINSLPRDDLFSIDNPRARNTPAYERIHDVVARIIDTEVPDTPKWIIHKIQGRDFYYGVNVWRGPIFEPFIITDDRAVFWQVLDEKEPVYADFQDNQGEWSSHISPILDDDGVVRYVLELYRPTETINRLKHDVVRRTAHMVFVAVLVVSVLIVAFSYLFMRPLRRLTMATEVISAGDFDHRVALRSRDELGSLAQAFNAMAARLKQFTEDIARTAAERERIRAELRFAREMQCGMLPTVFPPFAGYENIEIVAEMTPAREIGGDYFDFFPVDEDHFGVAVADVAGKGVPAGLFLMSVRTLLRSYARGRRSAAEVLGAINRVLASDNPTMMFVTVFYMVCNVRNGRAVFCNAGHPPPYFLHAGAAARLTGDHDAHGMALGVDDRAGYRDGILDLHDHDGVLLYTDGVTEAADRSDNMFGDDALGHLAQAHAGSSPRILVDAVGRAVAAHQTGREPADDVTVLAMLYRERGIIAENRIID